jgi:heat shock protein HslJ
VLRRLLLLLFAGVMVASAGCGEGPVDTSSGADDTVDDGVTDDVPPATVDGGELIGTSWTLLAGAGPAGEILLVDGFPITLVFDGDTVGGTAACNQYGGEYFIEGSSLGIDNLSMTAIGCQPEVQAAESAYGDALSDVDGIDLVGDELALSGPATELIFRRNNPVPIGDIVGRLWLLESLGQEDGTRVPLGDPATLLLAGDGTMTGSTGCRELSGDHVVSGNQVVFPNFAAVGDCPSALWDQDGLVINVLGDGFEPVVGGDRLTLTSRGNEVLVYRATTDEEVAALPSEPVVSDAELLADVEWLLVEAYTPDGPIELPDPDDPEADGEGIITLVLSPGSYGGELFCNRYGGPLEIGTGTIQFGPMEGEQEGCFEDAGAAYESALTRITEFGFDDPRTAERLVLTGNDHELIFESR